MRSQFSPPDQKTGTSVNILYEELGFPFTFQTVSFSPGTCSHIHNHGTWGIVAILRGKEKNTLWKCNSRSDMGTCIEKTGEIILSAGDIISFTNDAIHSVEAVSDEPTVTLNLYGETDPKQRFEYNPVKQSVKNF